MSKPVVLWVVGPPGAGKTTMVRNLLVEDSGGKIRICSKPKWSITPNIVAAGHYTGDDFDGADRIAYNGAARTLAMWRDLFSNVPLTILDGDRMSNSNIVEMFRGLRSPPLLGCAMLKPPPAILAERRARRGDKQNESWRRGRETKARRFFQSFSKESRFLVDPEQGFEQLLSFAEVLRARMA